MLVIVLSVIVTTIALIKYNLFKRKMERYVRHLPIAHPTMPLIGNALSFWCDTTTELFEEMTSGFNKVDTPSKAYMGPYLVVNLDKPDDIKTVLMSSDCHNKPYFYQLLGNTQGLFTMKYGWQWKPVRKSLNAAFNMKVLQSFVPIFHEKSIVLSEKLARNINGMPFDISDYMYACALDMVCSTTMGTEVDVQRNPNTEFVDAFAKVFEKFGERISKIWMHSEWLFRYTGMYREQRKCADIVQNEVNRVIAAKKEEFLLKHKNTNNNNVDASFVNSSKPDILIDQLMQSYYAGGISEAKIMDHICTMMGAGTDTSALTLSYTILMLAMHSDVQHLVHKELDSVFENGIDYGITYDKLQQLPYLECVLKETLRLFAPGPFISKFTTGDVALRTFTIPKDAFILISIHNLHRRKDIWGNDANEFKPERFLPENSLNRHPFSFLPFSAGPRNCIAYQYAMISMKVVLTDLLKRYTFTTNMNLSDLKFKFEVSLKPASENLIQIKQREPSSV